MLDTTGGKAGNDEDSASESSFGSSALCCGGDLVPRCRLGFQVEDDSQDHVERGAEQILQSQFYSSLVTCTFCFLTSDLHLACVCVGIMLQATARWEAFFSQIFPSESPCHYLGEIRCYALYYYHLLKAIRRSDCSVWIMSVRLINLIVSQLGGF